jgi:hypothetical protein
MSLSNLRNRTTLAVLRLLLIAAGAWVSVWWTSDAALAQTGFGAVGGVYIDPQGMLRETSTLSEQDLRNKLAGEAQAGRPSPDVAAGSRLRKVSLRRLEQAVSEIHEAGKPLPAEYRFLAGLTGIRYVLVYPESGDVVLAGSAEGWRQLPSGDFVGLASNRPVMQLDDLVVALRYSFADHGPGSFLGCSIEPTAQGVQAHDAYVRRLGGMDGSQVDQVVQGMEQAVGPQDIHVYGINPSSRFALQMVAADYRLKRIALAHDPSPVAKLPSYLDLAAKTVNSGPQRQHRWWFVGHYEAIRQTADRLAFEFEGAGLKVDTAPTQGAAQKVKNSEKPSRPAKLFAELASKRIPELAEKIPAVAELQNLVALAVAAVLIRRQFEGQESGGDSEASAAVDPSVGEARGVKSEPHRWHPRHFLDDKACPVATLEVPKKTPSLANVRFVKNQFWLFSVSGGVEIDPSRLADAEHLKAAAGPRLGESRLQSSPPADDAIWWWD